MVIARATNMGVENKIRAGFGLALVFLLLIGKMQAEENRLLQAWTEATHSSPKSGIEVNRNVQSAIRATLTAQGRRAIMPWTAAKAGGE